MTPRRPKRKDRRAQAKARTEVRVETRERPLADAPSSDKVPLWVPIVVVLALLAAVVLIYLPVRGYEFISLDDPQYVTANPVIRSGLTRAGLAWAFSSAASFYWHPLTWISHMLDVQLFGVNAGPHHLVNVAIHAANTALLFAALRRMTGATEKSAFVAAVFALHPLHVESVVWIAERKDVLSSFFWIAGMYAYTSYVLAGRRRWMVFTALFFIAGLLAKPMVVTFPFALLLLDYWPFARWSPFDSDRVTRLRPLIREKLLLIGLAVASVVMTLFSQRGSGAVVALEKLPFADRIANAIVSYAMYLRDFIWPMRLAPFYPLESPPVATFATAVVVLSLISFAVVRYSRSHPPLLMGWLWFLGTLVPVIGFVQAGDQARADRFMYVPMLGIIISLTWVVADLARRIGGGVAAWVLRGVAIAVLIEIAVITRHQTAFWRNDVELWGRTVAVTKRNYRAENLYGVALTDRGRLVEGISHYLAALEIWPEYPEAHNNLGTARRDEGRIDDAIHEFSEAARIKPGSSTFHFNLGVVLSDKGDTTAAIAELETALQLEPSNAQYRQALAIVRGAGGASSR